MIVGSAEEEDEEEDTDGIEGAKAIDGAFVCMIYCICPIASTRGMVDIEIRVLVHHCVMKKSFIVHAVLEEEEEAFVFKKGVRACHK